MLIYLMLWAKVFRSPMQLDEFYFSKRGRDKNNFPAFESGLQVILQQQVLLLHSNISVAYTSMWRGTPVVKQLCPMATGERGRTIWPAGSEACARLGGVSHKRWSFSDGGRNDSRGERDVRKCKKPLST